MLVYLRDGSAQTICRTEREVADPTFYLTRSQYTDTQLTNRSAGTVTPDAWTCNHLIASFLVPGVTRPGKYPASQAGIEPRICHSLVGRLNH